MACHLAGGTHHAFPDHGSGFCIFNDCAVAARLLLAEARVGQVMVVDLDVHQGDGTAVIFQDEARVFTFSAHGASNFPLRKQRSDFDLPLEDGLEDEACLAAVGGPLSDLLDQVRPDLVLDNAGVDPHRSDRLGRLCLSDSGIGVMRSRQGGLLVAESSGGVFCWASRSSISQTGKRLIAFRAMRVLRRSFSLTTSQ